MAKPLPGQPMLVQPGLSGMQLGLPGMQQQMQQQVAMQQQMAVAGGHMGGGGGAGMFSGYGLAGASCTLLWGCMHNSTIVLISLTPNPHKSDRHHLMHASSTNPPQRTNQQAPAPRPGR
jgi:hypothetical protein